MLTCTWLSSSAPRSYTAARWYTASTLPFSAFRSSADTPSFLAVRSPVTACARCALAPQYSRNAGSLSSLPGRSEKVHRRAAPRQQRLDEAFADETGRAGHEVLHEAPPWAGSPRARGRAVCGHSCATAGRATRALTPSRCATAVRRTGLAIAAACSASGCLHCRPTIAAVACGDPRHRTWSPRWSRNSKQWPRRRPPAPPACSTTRSRSRSRNRPSRSGSPAWARSPRRRPKARRRSTS